MTVADRGSITPGLCDSPAVMGSNLVACDALDVSDCVLEAAGEDHDLNEVAVCDSKAAEGYAQSAS